MEISSLAHFVASRKSAARTFRHLLRALLREATYLPDPAARSYYRSHILYSFRKHNRNQPVSPRRAAIREYEEVIGLQPPESKERRAQTSDVFSKERLADGKDLNVRLFLRARDGLRLLARANLGHERPLMKVLMSTYGRIGRRKWQLLQPYTLLEAPTDADEVRRQLTSDNRLSAADQLIQLTPQLKALVNNQIASKLPEKRSAIKQEPDIDQLNSWQKKLSAKRRKNVILEWRRNLESKLLPPLPDAEARRLRDRQWRGNSWSGVSRETKHAHVALRLLAYNDCRIDQRRTF